MHPVIKREGLKQNASLLVKCIFHHSMSCSTSGKPSLVRETISVSDHLLKPSQMRREPASPSLCSVFGSLVNRSMQWADEILGSPPWSYIGTNEPQPPAPKVPTACFIWSFIHLRNMRWTCTLWPRHCGWRDDQDFEPYPHVQIYQRDYPNITYLLAQLRGTYRDRYCAMGTLSCVTDFF